MVTTKIYKRLLKPPPGSFFLFGLRGAGKSAWVQQTFPDAMRFDLLNEGLYQSYLRDSRLFGRELLRVPSGQTVVVDEIQRLPSLLNEVHRFIEERKLRFVLLGSSAKKLKQSGANLLAGRALRRIMFPFLPAELGDDFDLNTVLRFGTLPIIWQSPSKPDSLDAYVQLFLKEEIQAEALVRNLPGFARFLPVASLFHCQVLSISGLARDAGVARTTVAGYINILEDTHLAWLLRAYEGRIRVKERKHPKLYWTDAGIVRAIRREFHPPGETERGALFEGWIACLLRAYGEPGSALGLPYDAIYFWSHTQGRNEVDFLIQRGREFIAIEVKAKETLNNRDFSGLRLVAELRGIKRRIVVFLGERQFQTEDGIEAIPFNEFIHELHEKRI